MNNPEDIMTTGPVGLEGIKGLSSTTPDERKKIVEGVRPYTKEMAHQEKLMNLGEVSNYATGQDLGSSRYDRPVYDLEDLQHIQDLRSQEQSSLNKIGAGIVKMGTTAATTFLDSTLGMLIGFGQGLVNMGDDDPNSTFRSGLWNNEFNKAMATFQENMEKWVPNYYSEAELDAPWYKNIGTANFWGDKFLKNMGFTIGAMASLAVPGFNMSWVPRASMGIARGVGAGYSGLKAANKAGKIATYALRTAISANGEANIEAINAVRDNYNLEIANLQNRKREAVAEASNWYKEHQYDDSVDARQVYLNRLRQIDTEFDQAKTEMENGLVNVGNSVHAANMLILSLTNSLEFGNYLKGGYNLQKGFKNLKMLADGKETASMSEFAKAATQGKAALAKAPITGAERTGKVIKGSVERALTEGFEEGSQRLASDTEQMKEQARINKWAKDTGDTFYGKGINPDIAEDLTDRFKALHHAWNTSFGDASSTGWEEVFLGALTGGIGTFNVRQNRQGKVGIGWQGGIGEAIRDVKEEEQDATKYIELFNKKIQDPKFREKYNHAMTAMTLADEMDRALNLEQVLDYKNKEMLKIVNDAYFFKSMDAMDFFKSFYEEMASGGLSEEDVKLVREELKTVNQGVSPFGTMTDSEIAETLQHKAKSTLDKINASLESYDYLNLKYSDKAYEAAQKVLKDDDSFTGGPAAMAEVLLRELASEAAVIWDMERRKSKIQREIDEMDEGTKAVRGTQIEDYAISQLNNEIAKKKALYENNLSNLEGLAKTIKRINDLAIRRETLKDNKLYKDAFKKAQSLQEVADLYFSIDTGSGQSTISDDDFNARQIVFEDAIEEAEGETKALLESFKPFLAATSALSDIINDVVDEKIKFDESGPSPTIEDITILTNARDKAKEDLKSNIQYIIRDYIEDSRNPYDKGSLADALRERVNFLDSLSKSETDPKEVQALKNTADVLKSISDELDKLDVVYQAAERDTEDDDDTDDESGGTSTEGGEEDEGGDGGGEEGPGNDKGDKGGKEEELEKNEPQTTIVNNRKDAVKYANRRLRKALGDNYDRFVDIISQDDPSQDDRDWLTEILRSKKNSFAGFVTHYMKESPYEDNDSGDSGVAPQDDKKKRDEEIATESENSVRANPYRPYLQGSGMDENVTEGLEDDDKEGKSVEERQKEIEESRARPGIINGIGELALEKAVNTKYYENWYNNKHFGPIARGIDYIVNNLMWDLMQIEPEGKLKVLYAEFYPKEGTRQTVFRGFKKPHILLVTPYTNKIEGVINRRNSKGILDNNIIETIGKDGKAHKYLVVGAYGYSSNNKALEQGHDIIDRAIMKQRQEGSGSNVWEVLEEGENGEYVNYVYDVSPGYVLRQHSEKDTGNLSLKEILQSSNFTGQTAKDIRISYWIGDEDSPQGPEIKWAHREKGDRFYEGEYSHNPGDVFVWIPTADGRYFPQRVSPIAFKELREGVNGQVYADIMNLIRTIAEKRTDKKEVKKALAALRGTDEVPGMLILSSKKQKGNKITYNEREGIITFYKDGVPLVDENIYLERDSTTTDGVIKQLVKMLGEGSKTDDSEETNGLNALVAMHGSLMSTANGREYYINSNIFNVNLRQWGTVNARAFAYPVRSDGTIDPLYVPKPTRSAGRTLDDPFKQNAWLNGHKYVYDTATGVVRDSNNQEVSDREILDEIADIRLIKESGMKPLMDSGSKYFVIGDRVYHFPRRNTFTRVDGERLLTIRKKAEIQKALDEHREIVHTREELEREIDRLQKKLDTLTVSNKEIDSFEPSTLDELVIASIYSYEPGEYNPDEFLSQGLDPAVIKHFSKGQKKFFSKSGKKTLSSLVDDIWQDAVERGFIRDDEQSDVLSAVLDALDVSILGTSYTSVKGRLREEIKSAIRAQKSQDLKYQIDMLEDELDAVRRKEDAGNPPARPVPLEDMPDFDTPPVIPNKKEVKISFITHSSNGNEVERNWTASIEDREGVTDIKFPHSITIRPEDVGLTARDFAGNSEGYSSISSYEQVVKDLEAGGFRMTRVVVRSDGTIWIEGVEGEVPIEGRTAKTIFDLIVYPMLNGQKVNLFGKTNVNIHSQVLTEEELKRKTEEEHLQIQERIATIKSITSQMSAIQEIDDTIDGYFDIVGEAFDNIGASGIDDAVEKIYNSVKTRTKLLGVSNMQSFMDLMNYIKECGI